MAIRILVVDDEKLIRWSLRERLSKEGYDVAEASDGASAATLLEEGGFDLALFDLRLPDTDGMSLLKRAKSILPEMPVMIITAYSSVENAVEAMKLGAYDYVTKPFNMDELAISVNRALETTQMKRRLSRELIEQKARFDLSNVVGKSPRMVEIAALVRKIARSEASTVLLRGESGTGKDVIARAIHFESNRADRPFMNITCTALPDTLLESELFGHEKGAFTDAKGQKKGLLELAHEGTVFLDEIGDMSAPLQAKILRVLEEKAFRRVGGTADIKVDVRIVAATNRDLEKAIEEKKFREDLYYRLNIVPIYIPPLRERREDLPLLAEHFVRIYNREFHRTYRGLTPEAGLKLQSYAWPGNVRELRNVMERAILLGTGEMVSADDITLGRAAFGGAPDAPRRVVALPPEGCNIEEVEKDLVKQALDRTNWNQTRAAELVSMSRDQIRYKIEKYGLVKPA